MCCVDADGEREKIETLKKAFEENEERKEWSYCLNKVFINNLMLMDYVISNVN